MSESLSIFRIDSLIFGVNSFVVCMHACVYVCHCFNLIIVYNRNEKRLLVALGFQTILHLPQSLISSRK